MAKTFAWDTQFNRIQAVGGTAEDPIIFGDIYQYFKANPLNPVYEYPRLASTCAGNELCEQNAVNWIPRNGFATPVDDAVEFTHNSYSVKATVSAVPTPDTTATSIYRQSAQYIRINLPDTSAYSVNEHIMIKGTANFDGIYLIQFIHAAFLQLRVPKSVDDLAPASSSLPATETSLTILKPLSLIWNDDRAKLDVIPIEHCQTMKFSVKTDSLEVSPVCSGIALRNMYDYTSNTEDRTYYGASLMKDFAMGSTWTDYEITIKDEFNLSWWVAGDNIGSRGYWEKLGKVGLFFEGLAVGDTVWIDGVRFNSDRNPTKDDENSRVYRFKTGLYVFGYFKDHGFTVIHDCLSSASGRYDVINNSTNSFHFNSSAFGNIEIGDYSGDFIEKDGGVFVIDSFSHEDSGNIQFNNCYVQGLTIRGNRGIASCGGIFCGNSVFKSCNFQNLLNLLQSFTLEDSMFSGGRYFLLGSGVGNVLKNVTVTGTRGQVWFINQRSATEYSEVAKLKVINQNNILYSYNFNATGRPYGARFIDLDVTECTNPYLNAVNNGGVGLPTYHQIAYSVNLRIVDVDGNSIEGAVITMKDKNGNTLFSETTNSNGDIAEQVVDTLTAYADGSASVIFYLNTPDVNWTKQYPFSLEISKAGYETYKLDSFTLTAPKKEEISLKTASDVMITNEGLGIKADPTNSTEDRNFLIV